MAGYDLKEIISNLTDTEKRIIETYIQKGGSAKEIASMLNVSERTVYKALYKYRKAALEMGIDPSNFYLRKTVVSSAPQKQSISPDVIEEMKEQLLVEITRIIEESIQKSLRGVLEEFLSEQKASLSLRKDEPKNMALQESQLEYVFLRLSETLEKLNANIEKLNQKIDKLDVPRQFSGNSSAWSRETYTVETSLPSFVQGNPWIDILSRPRVP
jgi:transposase